MHLDGDAEFVGQALQLAFPQADARAVAAAAVGGDDEMRCARGNGRARSPATSGGSSATAKAAVSWLMPTLTQPALPARS